MGSKYYRPIAQVGPIRPAMARPIAGGSTWFSHVAIHARGKPIEVVRQEDVPKDALDRICAPRGSICGLDMGRPQIMAILNVTPDSFSDGGTHLDPASAIQRAKSLIQAGADILDIGGESTRPGAEFVPAKDEVARVEPVVKTVTALGDVPVSLDTRKSEVAKIGLGAGASILNDVSALSFDDGYGALAASAQVPVCLMHAQGDPKTMQANPHYDDVLLDVYDYLEDRINHALSLGIAREAIIVDPGVGFGKTLEHNLRLIQNISLFHGLGVPILVGVSRKRFIGTLGNAPQADARAPGSIAVALALISQGVQIIRVHDMAETKQALDLHIAATGMGQI